MLFNSLHFLFFLPIVIIIYFLIPHKFRWILLLASSYYFYMSWKAEYIILIIISTLTHYVCALQISKSAEKKRKKFYLIISIIVDIGLLLTFKYFNFISESLREILSYYSIPFQPITLKVLLPIGISFYTFQALSYTIDVYRSRIQPEKHLGIFALYISYFPQLVAGPIERAKNLIPQFYQKHSFDINRLRNGLRLMLWGFFKKIVIADSIADFVNILYNNPAKGTGIGFVIATIFFGIQIFCDFSGYTDIARGSARIMGIRLTENFNSPYISSSIREFWRRWHITLSTWFRDYVYVAIGGNKVSKFRWLLNIIVVFFIGGLWHGANWTYVIWGTLHGFYIIAGAATKKARGYIADTFGLIKFPVLYRSLQIISTYVLVNFAWIFFRANSLSDALFIIQRIVEDVFPLNKIILLYFIIMINVLVSIIVITILEKFITIKKIRKILFVVMIAIVAIFSISAFINGIMLLLQHQSYFLYIFMAVLFASYYYIINSKSPIKEFFRDKPFLVKYSLHLLILLLITLCYQLLFFITNHPIVLLSLFLLIYAYCIKQFIGIGQFLIKQTTPIKWAILLFIIIFILLFGKFEEIPFIYFQF